MEAENIMKNIDIVSNDYIQEITLEQARILLKNRKTIEVRIYDDKDRIKYWEKYNICNGANATWSLKEIMNGRFFLVLDERC